MNHALKQQAQNLRLSGLLGSLDLRLQEAEANRLPYAQFLELVFQDEIHVRSQRTILRGENGIAALTFCEVVIEPAK